MRTENENKVDTATVRPMNLQLFAEKKSGVYPCYENQFQINTSESAANETMKTIADCETFNVAFDNGIEEWHPFEDEGWVNRLMTSKGITISVTAKRSVGDEGNDFVAGKAWKNGRDAEANFQWTFPDGTVIKFENAVINVTNVGAGDSIGVAPLEFEVQSNGKPNVTNPAA